MHQEKSEKRLMFIQKPFATFLKKCAQPQNYRDWNPNTQWQMISMDKHVKEKRDQKGKKGRFNYSGKQHPHHQQNSNSVC